MTSPTTGNRAEPDVVELAHRYRQAEATLEHAMKSFASTGFDGDLSTALAEVGRTLEGSAPLAASLASRRRSGRLADGAIAERAALNLLTRLQDALVAGRERVVSLRRSQAAMTALQVGVLGATDYRGRLVEEA